MVQGTRHNFEETLAKSGLDVEKQSLEVESLKEAFATSLAADIRRQLTESDAGFMSQKGANQLVQAVTALLTQSGLANIERACNDHIMVSGGEQELQFELRQGPPRCWDLVMSCKKFNFTSFVHSSQSDEAEVLTCAAGSQISRPAQTSSERQSHCAKLSRRFALVRLAAVNHLDPLSVEAMNLVSRASVRSEQRRETQA